jgi:signal transduction histidine kinase
MTMEINLRTVFNLLSTMPGNLVYYLILIYSLIACLLSLMSGYRAGRYPVPTRTLTGVAILFAAIILPAASIFSNQSSGSQPETLYPVLERTSLSWLMIWLAWLWLSPRRSMIFDLIAIGLSILFPALIAALLNSFPLNGTPFNASPADLIWHFAIILTTLVFIVILIRRQSPAGAYGVGMMSLLLAGFIASLIYMTSNGNISGAARLGVLCAFPLLPLLALRQELFAPAPQIPVHFDTIMTQAVAQPLPDQINAWLDAAGNSDTIHQQDEFARILCQALDASACVFLQQSERPGIIRLTRGYDLSNKSWIETKELASDGIPKTMECLKSSVPSVFRKTNGSSSEIDRFSAWLKLDDINSVAIIPVCDSVIRWGAAVLFRPSSFPSFQEDDLLPYLRTMASLSNIFRNSELAKKEKQDIGKLTTEINALQEKNRTLQTNLDTLRLSAVQVWPEPDLNQMLTLQQASQSEIDRIRNENRLLLQALAEEREDQGTGHSGTQSVTIEHELAIAREDLTHLQNLLNDSHRQVEEMEKRTTFSASSIDRLRKFSALTTQIRNPVAAITGYVDILLSDEESPSGESDDHATLENLNTSLARLRQIMNDLAEINILESGVIDLEPEPMDLGVAIDQAVANVSPSLAENGISLKLSLPESLPAMQTYHEALQKVIIHLLHNAGKATPPNGTIELRVDVHEESAEPYLLLEITDSGGGVAPENLKKVFFPADQNNGQSIHGLGETGNGLSAARTLIEAHGGRIWVDSNPGIGTTFSILLPIESNKLQNDRQTI